MPGFSEPKLEKACISEFRKTKSEKPGIYKEEKRSISESEKIWFFCISRFVTKISDFCQKNLVFLASLLVYQKNLLFWRKTWYFLFCQKKLRFQQKNLIFCISVNTQFSHQKTVFFLNKKKTTGFSGRRTRFCSRYHRFFTKSWFF